MSIERPAGKLWIVAILIAILTQTAHVSTLEERVSGLLSQMSFDEKIAQIHRFDYMGTATNNRLGITGFLCADGPHGAVAGTSTAFPYPIALAASWDVNCAQQIGWALGREFRGNGKNVQLGPSLDLATDPRMGRAAESAGEDPWLAGKIVAAESRGVQSVACIATLKHYTGYFMSQYAGANVRMDKRSLMELYTQHFRMAFQEGGAMSIMAAYNQINGQYCASNKTLLTTVLREHDGFPWFVMSDWGAASMNSVQAGLDLEMGSDNYLNLTSGSIVQIDAAVGNILRTKLVAGLVDGQPSAKGSWVDCAEHRAINLDAGRKCIVLLKNAGNMLPLSKNISKLTLIGPGAATLEVNIGGSSGLYNTYRITPRQGIENKIGASKVVYVKGCDINSTDQSGFSAAIQAASSADAVVYVGGIDASVEGEGRDRYDGTALPGNQSALINQLAAANPNIVVVLQSGGIIPVRSFVDNVKGLVYLFVGSQENGNALADVLFGDYNPGGKLPVTMHRSDADLPPYWSDQNLSNVVERGIGYRWFDKQNKAVEFAFGFGLSYTTFSYSNLRVSPSSAPAGQIVTVSADVRNSGPVAGEEVVQLYLKDVAASVAMPVKQLKGFSRIALAPGETKTVTFELGPEHLWYFDTLANRFRVEPGTFTAMVGGSSGDLPLTANFEITAATERPDLVVQNLYWIPPYPKAGDQVNFVAMIRNKGTGSLASTANVNFSVDGAALCVSEDIPAGLNPDKVALACGRTTWTATSGSHQVTATVDKNNQIPETIEGNNVITAPLILTGPSLNYDYYELNSTTGSVPNFAALQPTRSGTADNFDLSVASRSENYALWFGGYILIPTSGAYTFYTTSDDGSLLSIDGVTIVNNDGPHASTTKSGAVSLTPGAHAISVGYCQGAGGSVLQVEWSGPGIARQDIPDAVLSIDGSGATVARPGVSADAGKSLIATNSGRGILLRVTAQGRSTVTVTRADGRVVWISDGNNDYSAAIGADRLVHGVYVVRLQTPGQLAIGRFVYGR
jgi:beta-glucosidase